MNAPVATPDVAVAVIDPKSYADWNTALDLFDRLRAETPVVRIESPTDDHEPFWLVTGYDEVMKVSKDNATFLNAPRATVFTNKTGEMFARQITAQQGEESRFADRGETTKESRWSRDTRQQQGAAPRRDARSREPHRAARDHDHIAEQRHNGKEPIVDPHQRQQCTVCRSSAEPHRRVEQRGQRERDGEQGHDASGSPGRDQATAEPAGLEPTAP